MDLETKNKDIERIERKKVKQRQKGKIKKNFLSHSVNIKLIIL
jgi:hypothetical protein